MVLRPNPGARRYWPALHTYKKRAIREGSPDIFVDNIFLLLNNELVALLGPDDHPQCIHPFGQTR